MRWAFIRSSLLLIAGILMGIAGGAIIRSRNCELLSASGAKISMPSQEIWGEMLQKKIADSADEITPVLRAYERMTPLAQAGPFFLAFNPRNNDFVINAFGSHQPLSQQVTSNGTRNLTLSAIQADLTLDIQLNEENSEIEGVTYSVGGLSEVPKYSYLDADGDGQFDNMINYQLGIVYQKNGLAWQEVRRIPTSKPGNPVLVHPKKSVRENGQGEENTEPKQNEPGE